MPVVHIVAVLCDERVVSWRDVEERHTCTYCCVWSGRESGIGTKGESTHDRGKHVEYGVLVLRGIPRNTSGGGNKAWIKRGCKKKKKTADSTTSRQMSGQSATV